MLKTPLMKLHRNNRSLMRLWISDERLNMKIENEVYERVFFLLLEKTVVQSLLRSFGFSYPRSN